MLIEPRGGNLVFIRGDPGNPDWQEPVAHPMFLQETSGSWRIDVAAHRIIVDREGNIFIDGDAYKKSEPKRDKTRKKPANYIRAQLPYDDHQVRT
jgi:hypothetical protein